MRNSVEVAVRNAAATNINPKFNLAQYKKEGTKNYELRQKALLHKKVCEEIVAFMEEYKDWGMPVYYILSVGVSKGAFKMSEFEKGYKSFNAQKVLDVWKFGQLYNAHNGLADGRKLSDVTIRLVMRYYEKVSTSVMEFVASLRKSKVLGKKCGSREIPYGELCKNLGIPYNEKLSTTGENDKSDNLSDVA